jgi:hypothetical protein
MSQAVNENPTIEEQTWHYGRSAGPTTETLASLRYVADHPDLQWKDATPHERTMYLHRAQSTWAVVGLILGLSHDEMEALAAKSGFAK